MSDPWNPRQYGLFEAERARPFEDLLELLVPVEGGTAVDLGCGTGALTARLHRALRLGSTLGIDSSEAMIERARPLGENGLRFAHGDIAGFTRERFGQFDVICSNAALHWLPDHSRLFTQLVECLAPRGQLAVQVPSNFDAPSHQVAFAIARESPYRELLADGPVGVGVLALEQYAQLLFRLGFVEQRVRQEVYAHVLESRDDVVEWVKGSTLTWYQERLSREHFAGFVDLYRRRLFEVLPDERPFLYPFKRTLLWGRL